MKDFFGENTIFCPSTHEFFHVTQKKLTKLKKHIKERQLLVPRLFFPAVDRLEAFYTFLLDAAKKFSEGKEIEKFQLVEEDFSTSAANVDVDMTLLSDDATLHTDFIATEQPH